MIQVSASAPAWAQRLGADVDAEFERRLYEVRPLPVFTIATLPPANTNAWCIFAVSDGVSSRFAAISNGSAWYYLDGVAV